MRKCLHSFIFYLASVSKLTFQGLELPHAISNVDSWYYFYLDDRSAG